MACVVVHQCDRYFRFVNFKGDGKNKKEKIQKKDKTGYGDGNFLNSLMKMNAKKFKKDQKKCNNLYSMCSYS